MLKGPGIFTPPVTPSIVNSSRHPFSVISILSTCGFHHEVCGVVRLGALEPKGREERYDVSALALEHALALAHDVHVVEHVEQLGGGRVHTADDGPPAARQHLEQLDALRGGQVVQPGGRLVQEDDGRVVDELLGDGQPLALAAGQLRGLGVTCLG